MKTAVFWDELPQCGKSVLTFQKLLPPSSGQRKLLAKRTYHSFIYIFLIHFSVVFLLILYTYIDLIYTPISPISIPPFTLLLIALFRYTILPVFD
jgi:hypothetical protein